MGVYGVTPSLYNTVGEEYLEVYHTTSGLTPGE